jgi:hypothetical protein
MARNQLPIPDHRGVPAGAAESSVRTLDTDVAPDPDKG